MNPAIELSWASFFQALPDIYLAPIVTGGAAGLALGFIGVYVVLRRMIFISAALSQVSGVGVALAFYLQIHAGLSGLLGEPVLMALFLSLAATLVLRPDPQALGLTRNSVLGLVYVLAGGLALFLGTRISQEAHDINSILFGVGVAVRQADLVLTLVVGAGLVLAHLYLVRGLAFLTFDPRAAKVQGLPVQALETFLFFSVAVLVAITTRALGALPVFGLSVLPAMAALVSTRRLAPALALAATLGCAAGVLGYVYAFFTRFPVGASQTVLAGVFTLTAIGLRLARSSQRPPWQRGAVTVVTIGALSGVLWPLWSPSTPTQHEHAQHQGARDDGHDQRPAGSAATTATPDPEVLRQIIHRCDDAERCAEAVHQLGHRRDAHDQKLFVALLQHADWGVRAEAVEALGAERADSIVPPVSRVLLEDDSSWVKSAAVEALAGVHSELAIRALTEALHREADAETRRLIEQGLEHQRSAALPQPRITTDAGAVD